MTELQHAPQQYEKRVIALVDMDCFFCACEVKRNPKLKGKPVVVGALPEQGRGVVSTANYEARTFGVKSALPISVAYRRCPDAVFLPVDFTLYREESQNVMRVLRRFATEFSQVSVDEAYLDITDYVATFGRTKGHIDLAVHLIKAAVQQQTGLTCSIGVSYSKTVAKIAADCNKPNGVTLAFDQKQFLAKLPISKVPGVGKATKDYLNAIGIEHVGDVLRFSKFKLIDIFGSRAPYFESLAKGELYTTTLYREAKEHSYSRERTFLKDEGDFEKVAQKLVQLCDKVHGDLEHETFKTISIKVRFNDFVTLTRATTLSLPSKDLDTIKANVLDLFAEFKDAAKPIRLIGVRIGKLCRGQDVQMNLESFV